MSIAMAKPPKQLHEMLRELQEPFEMDIYLVKNRKKVDSVQSLNCCDQDSDKFLARSVSCSAGVLTGGITYCQKVEKVIYKRLFCVSNWARTRKKNIEDKEVETTEDANHKEVGDFDGFAAVGEEATVLLDAENQGLLTLNTPRSFIARNSGVAETKECLEFSLFDKQPKSEAFDRQTMQLLIDYLKEVIEVRERKKQKLQRHDCYSTSEELHHRIGYVNFASLSFDVEGTQEWCDYESQKKDVGSEIADILLEEIKERIVTEIIYSL